MLEGLYIHSSSWEPPKTTRVHLLIYQAIQAHHHRRNLLLAFLPNLLNIFLGGEGFDNTVKGRDLLLGELQLADVSINFLRKASKSGASPDPKQVGLAVGQVDVGMVLEGQVEAAAQPIGMLEHRTVLQIARIASPPILHGAEGLFAPK